MWAGSIERRLQAVVSGVECSKSVSDSSGLHYLFSAVLASLLGVAEFQIAYSDADKV